MDWNTIWEQFLTGIKATGWVEYIAVVSGILSVWFSKKENVLVYPVGLINTIFYTWLSFKGHLLGEASVNIYYTVMSIYGWYLWIRKDQQHQPKLHITFSNRNQWLQQIAFFAVFYIAIYFSLVFLKKSFAEGAIPWADAFASASAYTGMWLMAKKKVESWYWWLITDIASVPLYFAKGYVMTSVYYLILVVMAVAGLVAWYKKAKQQKYGA